MGANITARTGAEVAALLAAADRADRDADGEFPGSYYRKAHRARARRLRTKAAKLAHGQPDLEPEYTSDDAPGDDDPSLTEPPDPTTGRRERCPVCGGLNPGDITHTRC